MRKLGHGPPSSKEQMKGSGVTRGNFSFQEDKFLSNNMMDGVKGTAAIGAVGSIPSFYYLSQIDDNLMEAMQFAFTEDLSHFNNLHNYIEDKYFDAVSSASAEGWMTRLEGYVTEVYAADVLTKMGYDVHFPDSANQEGWDLIVDGEPWQVKGGMTESTIINHFEKNPDISVVTSQIMAEKFGENNQILGLAELDPDTMHRVTQESLGAVDNLGDTVGAGIPIVTLAVSGFREFNLLTSGDTDGFSSAKNLGLDVAGVGGGGFAGAQIGAGIGAIGGPIGMAVGGLIGGVAGAIAGKMGTNAIKQANYKSAINDLSLIHI